MRRASGIKKIGHAGTLDPMATGVLILCVGGATRLSEYVMHGTKRYTARVRLGVVTDTYDAQGEIVEEHDASAITQADVERALEPFRGAIAQVPPMYSAIKQGGRKLYDLARAGQTVEREPRPVQIDALTLTDWSAPEFTLDVVCSAGTYIRSLGYDIGAALGVGAHLTALRRTASGVFTLENAVPLATLLDNPSDHVISPRTALTDYPALVVDAAAETEIRHGRFLPLDRATEQPIMAYDADGRLIAVLEADNGWLKPGKVFASQP